MQSTISFGNYILGKKLTKVIKFGTFFRPMKFHLCAVHVFVRQQWVYIIFGLIIMTWLRNRYSFLCFCYEFVFHEQINRKFLPVMQVGTCKIDVYTRKNHDITLSWLVKSLVRLFFRVGRSTNSFTIICGFELIRRISLFFVVDRRGLNWS